MTWLAGREFGDYVTVGCHWLQTVLRGGQSYDQREVIKVINSKMLKEQLSKPRKRESILRWFQDTPVTQQRMWTFIRYSDTETLHWQQEQPGIQSIPSMTSKTRALLRTVEARCGGTCLQLQCMGSMGRRSPYVWGYQSARATLQDPISKQTKHPNKTALVTLTIHFTFRWKMVKRQQIGI